MKMPSQEEKKELIETPYRVFEGVDYVNIMDLKIPAIRIDSKNEQKQHTSDQIDTARKNSTEHDLNSEEQDSHA